MTNPSGTVNSAYSLGVATGWLTTEPAGSLTRLGVSSVVVEVCGVVAVGFVVWVCVAISPVGVRCTPSGEAGVVCAGSGISLPHHFDILTWASSHDICEQAQSDFTLPFHKGHS